MNKKTNKNYTDDGLNICPFCAGSGGIDDGSDIGEICYCSGSGEFTNLEGKFLLKGLKQKLHSVEEKKVEEIVNDIKQLKTTRPDYESNVYDEGLKDMKRTILQLIR
jgi:hypothetical protein